MEQRIERLRAAAAAASNRKQRHAGNRRRMLLFYALLLFMLIALMAGPAAGEPENSDKVFAMGEVVVTGKAETISGVSTVETLSEEQIDETNVANVSDALNTLPGVYLSVGRKNERNINIRGFNQRYVPVFLDGIPMYIPYDGYVDTGSLLTNNISKITLTKGNASVLYGPNTMAGAVNIVTKNPEKPFEAKVSSEYMEGPAWNTNIDLGSRFGKVYTMVNGGLSDSGGYYLSDDFVATQYENGGERENSDAESKNVSAKIGFEPSSGHDYAMGVQVVDREYGIAPITEGRARYWRFNEWNKTTYYLLANSRHTDQLSSKVRLYRDTYYNVLDSYDDDTYTTQNRGYAFHSIYDDCSNGASIVLRSTHLADNTLSLSMHYKEDEHRSQGDYGDPWERYEQKTFSYGLENDYKVSDTLAFVVGASYDINEPEYANGGTVRDDIAAFNPQLGILWTVAADYDVHFSVGKKTRFPTLHELYSEHMGSNIANPNLKEETAINWELGLNKPLGPHSHLTVALFYSDVDNLIQEKVLPSLDEQYQNIGKSLFKGFECSLTSTLLPRNKVGLHYTFLDAKDESPGRASDKIEEQSPHKIYFSDRITVTDRLSFFVKATYNSERDEEVSGVWKKVDDFWVVDAKATFNIFSGLRTEAGFKNLFDENYELRDGYPREGRSFFGKVTFTY